MSTRLKSERLYFFTLYTKPNVSSLVWYYSNQYIESFVFVTKILIDPNLIALKFQRNFKLAYEKDDQSLKCFHAL